MFKKLVMMAALIAATAFPADAKSRETVVSTFSCYNFVDLIKLRDYQKDQMALSVYILNAVLDDKCIIIDPGTKVEVVVDDMDPITVIHVGGRDLFTLSAWLSR